MIEIRQGCASFLTTSQRHVYQVMTLLMKGWFSDFEILEIRQKTKNQQNTNTVSGILGFAKQEQSNRNEPPTSEKRNTTTLSNNREQTLTQELKINF